MSRPKFLTKKFIECAIRYAVYFLAVAITPFFAKPIAPLFDWAGYSLMRPLFVEVFTIIFWGLEWLVIFLIERFRRKRERKEGEEAPKKKWQIKEPIPLKNLLILTVLSIVCLFIVSAIIGFEVKPIYDIGEKVTGYEIWNAVGKLGRNVFKCFWILGIVKACKGMSDEFFASIELPKEKEYLAWILAGAGVMVFGIFDILTSVVTYPMTVTSGLLGLAYVLVYALITAVYALTEKSEVKSFLLIVLIYMF